MPRSVLPWIITLVLLAFCRVGAEDAVPSGDPNPPLPATTEPENTPAPEHVTGETPASQTGPEAEELASAPAPTASISDLPSAPLSDATIEPLVTLGPDEGSRLVYVVPVKDAIFAPTFFIVRRALKEAIRDGADVIIHMDTPGGELGAMLDIMEALDRFEGNTVTFIDDEAISAGSFIALSTDRIFFHPSGIIGAAEPVTAGGGDVNEGMKRKLESYLRAKVNAMTSDHPRRAEILRAMFEPDFRLEIDGELLADEGELLSLTADQAARLVGDPPAPLLSDGTASTLEAVLDKMYGTGNYSTLNFELTWSETVAQYLKKISPILISVGMLLLFTEFKTPGFGVFGLLGIVSLSLVFVANSIAGLAGYEVGLLLLIGLGLIAIDIFLLPGTFVLGGLGILIVAGTFLWSLADIWPAQGGGDPIIVWSSVADGLRTLSFATLLGIAGLALLLYYIPRSRFFDRLAVMTISGGGVLPTGVNPDTLEKQARIDAQANSMIGKTGTVTRDLRPVGEVEIDNKRHPARSTQRTIPRGTPIRVIGHAAFNLVVEKSNTPETDR